MSRKSTKVRRRAIRYGMAVLGHWRFFRDHNYAYAQGHWYASGQDGQTVGPFAARWMAVDKALRLDGVR